MKTDADDLGPLSFEELIVLVNAGALGAEDLVRSSGHVAWQRAQSIPGLFSATVESPAKSAWSETVNSALASVDVRRRGSHGAASKASGKAGRSFARGGAVIGRGLTGASSLFLEMASSIVELAVSIGESAWKSRIVRTVIVVATIAAAAFVSYSAIPVSWFLSTASAVQTIEGIGEGVQQFRGRATTDPERQSFVEESRRELARMLPLLERQASDDQAARELVYAARDCLPKMIDATSDSDDVRATERRFANHLTRVKRLQARKPPSQSVFDATTVAFVIVDIIVVAVVVRMFMAK